MTFDPLSLFSQAQAGAWYDPSDLSTMFQDTAASVPVTAAGQAVARINDKSGNVRHLTQSTAARCPTYEVAGNGKAHLLFDGTDDFLSASFPMTLPFDRVSGIQQLSWTLNDAVFWAGSSAGLLTQNSKSPQLRIVSGGTAVAVQNGALDVGQNGIVTERHVANASKLAINNGSYVSGDAGSGAPTSLSVGASSSASGASNIRLYGMLMRAGSLSDDEMASLRSWMAAKSGVDLTRRKPRHSYWLVP